VKTHDMAYYTELCSSEESIRRYGISQQCHEKQDNAGLSIWNLALRETTDTFYLPKEIKFIGLIFLIFYGLIQWRLIKAAGTLTGVNYLPTMDSRKKRE